MSKLTYSEKMFSIKSGLDAKAGDIIYAEPDIILTHDNTISISKTFTKMGGKSIKYPDRLVVVLDHDAPPTSIEIANDHQLIRKLSQNALDSSMNYPIESVFKSVNDVYQDLRK